MLKHSKMRANYEIAYKSMIYGFSFGGHSVNFLTFAEFAPILDLTNPKSNDLFGWSQRV